MSEIQEDLTGVKYWFSELEEAAKRDKDYRKEGKRIIGIYECEDPKKVPFNILYSNVDTLMPALYSALPRPVVQRRFKDADPIGKAATEAGTRMLEYLTDTNIDGYETFNEGASSAVMDALLPGRGVTRIKYDAEIGEYLEHEGAEVEPVGGDAEEDAKEPLQRKESELVCVDSIAYDKVLFGYAKKWSKVPWIAFEEVIDKDEAVRLFGAEMAAKIEFLPENTEASKDDENNPKEEHIGGKKTAIIYQIWDKDGGRKVRYVSKQFKDDYLKVEDDPLELAGFYPIPKPIVLLAKSGSMKVTAPYLAYENQAKELNTLTQRISKIAAAIKAKGVYDPELGQDIENLMRGEDNAMIPADKGATLAAEKGFDNAIWFMPVNQLMAVLSELYKAREACKQVIYEVTGISDIIRGSTVASETATAQNIKSQWGTMRLKRNQGEAQRYCRDMMRIMLEIAATKFSEESWVKMTGLPFATEQQVQQAQMIMQAAQQYGQQLPEQLQAPIQQAQQVLQSPQWSQVLGLLRDDIQRSFRIDIETNSTVLPEATEDKQNMNEALGALSSFIKEALPVVQQGYLSFDGFKEILLKITRQFQFGDELESIIDGMQPPPPPQQPQDNTLQAKQLELQAKAQSEQAATQADIEKFQAESQKEAQALEANRMIEQGKAQTQIHIEQMRIDSAEKIALYQAELDAKTRLEIARIQAEKTIHDLMDAELQRQADLHEAERQREADLIDTLINQPVEQETNGE